VISRTIWEVDRNKWGVCERALKPHAFSERPLGDSQGETGIRKSDLPGL
jgi:hypothetical protein